MDEIDPPPCLRQVFDIRRFRGGFRSLREFFPGFVEAALNRSTQCAGLLM